MTVAPSTIPGAGRGLFADQTWKPGSVIIAMVQPSIRTDNDVPVEDCGLWISPTKFLHDASPTEPTWYLMNHSSLRPNVRPEMYSVKSNRRVSTYRPGMVVAIRFVALRTIDPGEELLYNYNEPDPSWALA